MQKTLGLLATGENGRGNPSLLGNGVAFENSRFLRDTMAGYTTNCSRWLITRLVLFARVCLASPARCAAGEIARSDYYVCYPDLSTRLSIDIPLILRTVAL